MPGIQPSPGMRDVQVCYGAYKAGSDGVQTAMQRARWKYDHQPLQKSGTLDVKRYSDLVSPVDSDITNTTQSQDEVSAPSSPSVHDGFEALASPPPVRQVPLDQEESGLPPTPPNVLTNGDAIDTTRKENISPPPLFADGVRNALRSEQSSTPVKQQASPPTPDPSPPRRIEQSRTPTETQSKGKSQFLQPLDIAPDEIARRQSPSSHAESFRTAQEDQFSISNAGMSPVQLPEEDRLPQHWLDTTRDLQTASIGLGDLAVEETPKIEGSEQDSSTPRQQSPQDATPGTRSDRDTSFPHLSDPSQRNDLSTPTPQQNTQPKGLGLSQTTPLQSPTGNVQDYNNQVYRRIQEENVKRHSTVSAKSGAITVGIVVPALDTTPKTLKRQTKSYSLRGDVDNGSPRDRDASIGGEQKLTSKKLRRSDGKGKLDESPALESKIRQVSSPAKLGADASDMTALTFASMQDSPTARRTSKLQPGPTPKLRHFSHEDRLSKNMSVRRTSLEASPPLSSVPFVLKPDVDRSLPPITTTTKNVTNNMAVKRSNADGVRSVTQPIRTPKQTSKTLPPLEELSPSGRLRHFSHEARLENNENVRRTSLDRASQSPQQTERPALPGSFDKSTAPSSERKSLDARYLYPTTTPMSVSQMSDRTDNIEIGEANGVRLYPHNNDSLLVVQNSSRPTSKGKDSDHESNGFLKGGNIGLRDPVFAAQVEPPTPTSATTRYQHQVDSPLTNPRTAPEPPIFKFIPPTPERDLINQENDDNAQQGLAIGNENSPPRKRLSLVQRARRYSDIILPGLGSLRRPSERRSAVERDQYLSPLWRPQGFWDDFDSEDEYDDFEPAGILPRGGDTSNVGDYDKTRKALFPRAMSKRLPGFRGTGGFLVGNSLGIDRHGSNNRRHYVSTSSRTLSKRQSAELMQKLSSPSSSPHTSAQLQHSPESLRRVVQARTAFVIPFTGGSRAYWVGTKRFRAKMRALRLAREERERERRREKIRRSIGHRVYHDQNGRTGT